MNKLKELRHKSNFTQLEAAKYFGISLRSYRDYENDSTKVGTIKYNFLVESFEKILFIDEQNGLLTIDVIKEKCSEVFKDYNVTSCYLFGSYAKGNAKDNSDVDLLISTELKGLKYYDLVEKIRVSLHKKVDILDVAQLKDNMELLNEILKDGIKIYG